MLEWQITQRPRKSRAHSSEVVSGAIGTKALNMINYFGNLNDFSFRLGALEQPCLRTISLFESDSKHVTENTSDIKKKYRKKAQYSIIIVI